MTYVLTVPVQKLVHINPTYNQSVKSRLFLTLQFRQKTFIVRIGGERERERENDIKRDRKREREREAHTG